MLNTDAFYRSFVKLVRSIPTSALADGRYQTLPNFLKSFVGVPSNQALSKFSRMSGKPLFLVHMASSADACDVKSVVDILEDPRRYLGPYAKTAIAFWLQFLALSPKHKRTVLDEMWNQSPRMHVDDEFKSYISFMALSDRKRNAFLTSIENASKDIFLEMDRARTLTLGQADTYYTLLWMTLKILNFSAELYINKIFNLMELLAIKESNEQFRNS